MWLEQHLRHRRGYGIHSPFLYGIVRGAMMPRRIVGSDRGVYDRLIEHGVGRTSARRLQNLHSHLGYRRLRIDEAPEEGDMAVATRACSEEQIRRMLDALSHLDEASLCIPHPLTDGPRRRLCRALRDGHNSLSASKPTFHLFFKRKGLSKQHIVI